ncbi:MAG: hypothetical protein R3264_19500, partial [Anaerolineae bacterium]|nr:hypothetical protein [Anaerolineae bacterium]
AFSPDGQTVASGSADQTVRLWNIADIRNPEFVPSHRTLPGHRCWVYALAFRPDGQILAVSSADETVTLWQVQTNECLTTLRVPGPYQGMNISGVRGLTKAQKAVLKVLGAVEDGRPHLSESAPPSLPAY